MIHTLHLSAILAAIMGTATWVAPSASAQDQQTVAPVRWTEAAQKKGYVVFRHSPMQILHGDYVPPGDAAVEKVNIELARGESESIFIGVHNFAVPPEPWPVGRHGSALIDVWAEVTIDLDVKVYYRNVELHQLVYGNVIDRIDVSRTGGFWLTVSAGPQTPAGVHSGNVMIVPANGPPTELALDVHVLPFVLQRARPSFAAYFHQSDDPYVGYRRRMAEDVAWRRAIYTNMVEYGMTSVDLGPRGGLFDDTGHLRPAEQRAPFEQEVDMAMRCGLFDPHTPVICHLRPSDDAAIAKVSVAQLSKLRTQKHWPPFVHYLTDEPTYPKPEVRRNAIRWRSMPLRVVTSLTISAAYGHGDVHDVWIVYAGHITPELKAEAHRLGAEVWTYTHNIANGQPLRNRYFAGLYTWAQGAGGNWIWAYYRNLIHNRLVWSHNADNVFYPGVGYEMRREGIDDYRYLQMLEDSIAAKPNDATAAEAAAWLGYLKERLVNVDPTEVVPGDPLDLETYDAIRRKAARYIERLGVVPSRDNRPWAEDGLRDEAALFRTQSTDACIAALANPDSSVRRAAALALYERSGQAAPAVDALARLLDDPEVRICALRALEAVGPKASPALARVTALLSHADPFIRIGAVYTLGAMGSPAAEALSTVRDDPFKEVSHAATTMLEK